MSFLGGLISLGGVLHGLAGVFVSSLMIFFAVVCRGNTVSVRGEIVELGGSLVRVLRHILFLLNGQLDLGYATGTGPVSVRAGWCARVLFLPEQLSWQASLHRGFRTETQR